MPDPKERFSPRFINEDTGFHCGYKPVEQSEEDET